MDEYKRLNIQLDAGTVRDLDQLQRQINASLPEGVMPPFTLAALARHAIRKWCEYQSAPVPKPWSTEEDQLEDERKLEEARNNLTRGV